MNQNNSPEKDTGRIHQDTRWQSIMVAANYVGFFSHTGVGSSFGYFYEWKWNQLDTFRGIAVLPIIEKIFEIVVYNKRAVIKLTSVMVVIYLVAAHTTIYLHWN